jgi:MtaA/CmuA family methyltransferase
VNGRERILACLAGEPVDSLPLMPITMMFAGDTAGIRYGEYARDYRKMVEAQIRTAETYDFDYVSTISDPAREASDLGAVIEWFDDQPPAINESRALLGDKAAFGGLRVPDPMAGPRMGDRVRGVALLKQRVGRDKLVEGWVEGPCAMAADLRGINNLMFDFSDDPEFVRMLFEFVVEMEIGFAKAQVEAGADLIGVGDAAASLVGPKIYKELVLPFEQKLVAGLKGAGAKVRLHICGNTRRILDGMGKTGADIVDLDYPSPLNEARAQMGPAQVLLGNIHPVKVLKDGTPELVETAIAECHQQSGGNYIVGAGCEVPRGTPPENLLALIRYAKSHR